MPAGAAKKNVIDTCCQALSFGGLAVLVGVYSLGLCFRDHHGEEHPPARCVTHVNACPDHVHHTDAAPGGESCEQEHHHGGFHLHDTEPVLVRQGGDMTAATQAAPPPVVSFLHCAPQALLQQSAEGTFLARAMRYGPGTARITSAQNLPLLI